MKWIVKIVFNKIDLTHEVHPPYSLENSVKVPSIVGNENDLIYIKYITFNTKEEAENYFQNYQIIESVHLIKDVNEGYGTKVTSL